MVCCGDIVRGLSSARSNVDLEIGCFIDLASGLVSFTANGKELPTSYQVLQLDPFQNLQIQKPKSPPQSHNSGL